MRTSSLKPDELDLELPALDGDDDAADADLAAEGIDDADEALADAFDDRTGEDAPLEEIAVEGAEGGWLVDADNAGTLDLGPLDLAIAPEGKVLEGDEADDDRGLDDLVPDEEAFVADGGEEGPLADDEELREEDLPALDADEDGDVADDDLYDRAILATDEDLRWADRAWERAVDLASLPAIEETDDSGVLAVPGDDPAQSARDAAWRGLDLTGRLMAAVFVPGGSVVIALATSDRARAFVVRIPPDGEARIIAEVDPRTLRADGDGARDDDGDACAVTFLRWDAARGCLFVGGNFGVEAYRPG